eukprot:350699-Chlamydomonas_euryale.AAC.4
MHTRACIHTGVSHADVSSHFVCPQAFACMPHTAQGAAWGGGGAGSVFTRAAMHAVLGNISSRACPWVGHDDVSISLCANNAARVAQVWTSSARPPATHATGCTCDWLGMAVHGVHVVHGAPCMRQAVYGCAWCACCAWCTVHATGCAWLCMVCMVCMVHSACDWLGMAMHGAHVVHGAPCIRLGALAWFAGWLPPWCAWCAWWTMHAVAF